MVKTKTDYDSDQNAEICKFNFKCFKRRQLFYNTKMLSHSL